MAPQAAGCNWALRRRGSGPGRGARDNAAEAGRASRVADSGCSAPARAAPPRHRPPAWRPHGAGSLPRSGPAGVLQSPGHRAAAAQRVEGRGRRAGRWQGGPRPGRQVWGTRSERVPRRAPPARLLPALPPARPATPGAAAASWRGPPRSSRASRSAGWGQPPMANQETYAKLEAGPRAVSPQRRGSAVAESTPPSLHSRLQFTSQCLKSFYLVYLLLSLSPRRSPESKDLVALVHSWLFSA